MIPSLRESDTSVPCLPVNGFRLRGVVADREKTFHLPIGTYRLGSSGANELALPVPCVSRLHALLRVTPRGLEVEDQGSTNGTWVGDRRIERGVVSFGEIMRFGPVSMRVEPLDEEEAQLAVDLMPAIGDGSPGLVPEEVDSTEPLGSVDLTLIERFVIRLADGDPEGALAVAIKRLRAEGACALTWRPEADPTVLAAWGRIGRVPSHSAMHRLLAGRLRRSAEGHTMTLVNEPQLVGMLRWGRRAGGVGLLFWGAGDSDSSSAPLLSVLVSLIAQQVPQPVPAPAGGYPGPRQRDPELVFPDGYRPGSSPAAVALYRQIRILLKGDIPVFIRGETGVGKEQVARILHGSSPRRQGPFLAINCSAIPAELLEAELFGIGKAVATGVEPRAGIFELAAGGTLLLDEIGEMPLALQAKLLRVLQEKEIHPVGGKPRKIDVRILAATNADLTAMMASGQLRRDLYYRLSGYSLEVPPLRHCTSDVPGLAEYFLRVFSREIEVRIRGLTLKAMRLLAHYSWPGNVRELENEIRRMVYQAGDGEILDSSMLSSGVREQAGAASDASSTSLGAGRESLALAPRVRAFEAELIREALARAGGNQTQAAKLLGLSRNGLIKKMNRLGVRPSPAHRRGR